MKQPDRMFVDAEEWRAPRGIGWTLFMVAAAMAILAGAVAALVF